VEKKYFVGSISFDTTEQGLADYFSQYGKVISVGLVKDKMTGKSKGFAFITMDVGDTSVETVASNTKLDGRNIYVDLGLPSEEREGGKRPGGFSRNNSIPETLIPEPPSPIIDISKYISLELIELLKIRPSFIYEISSRKFEELIAELVESFGYKIELTKQTRDGGKDIIATKIGEKNESFYIECKRNSPNNLISVDIVREFHSVLVLDKINKGILATSSYFTSDSKKLIERINHTGLNVDLKDFNGVFNWIDLYLDRKTNSDSSFLSPPLFTFLH
jgi:RNA recognition motif-containing protein